MVVGDDLTEADAPVVIAQRGNGASVGLRRESGAIHLNGTAYRNQPSRTYSNWLWCQRGLSKTVVVKLRGHLSRLDVRLELDELDQLIKDFKTGARTVGPRTTPSLVRKDRSS